MAAQAKLSGLRPIRIPSIHERAADTVEEHILSNELPAGTVFTEQSLVDAFNVSRPTAKDALRLLLRRSILRQVPNHSAHIPVLGEKDYKDMLVARRVIDSAVIERMATITTKSEAFATRPAHFRKLKALIVQLAMDAHPSRQDVIAHEVDFHNALVDMTGSPAIDSMNQVLTHEFHLGLIMLGKNPDPVVLAEQHESLLNGIVDEEEVAIRSVHNHVSYLATL